VERPREHAVDAEVFAQLTECGLSMIKRGQAANQVRGDLCYIFQSMMIEIFVKDIWSTWSS